MKASPYRVAELLGDETLELLYMGTEEAVNGQGSNVQESQGSLQSRVEIIDSMSERLYYNLRELIGALKSSHRLSREELCANLSGATLSKGCLDAQVRNYVNGFACKDDPEDDESGSSDTGVVDRSLKGSVDVLLGPLLRLLLRTGKYVSTSCCSGRIVLFESNPEHATMATKRSKTFGRAGRFLYSSHCHIDDAEYQKVVRAFNAPVQCKHDCYQRANAGTVNTEGGHSSDWESTTKNEIKQRVLLMKFEPFVLHVECTTLEDAVELLQICRSCGLKQSGIISCGKRVIVSICGKTTLEAPVALRHYHSEEKRSKNEALETFDRLILVSWLISSEYLQHLVAACNRKFSASVGQMLRLYWTCVRKFGVDIMKPFALPMVTAREDKIRGDSTVAKRIDTDRETDSSRGPDADNSESHGENNRASSALVAGEILLPGAGHNDAEVCHSSGSRNLKSSSEEPKGQLYVGVKDRAYIKNLKEVFERNGVYDRSRKILTPSICETYEPQGDAADGSEVVTYVYSVVQTDTPSAGSLSEEVADPSAVHTIESRRGYQPAGFVPVVGVTESLISKILDETPNLKERVVLINGLALCRVNERVVADIISARAPKEPKSG